MTHSMARFGGVAFSSILKINKNIGYLLRVEVTWVNLLMEFMGCSSIKARPIYYWMVVESSQVVDEVIYLLEILFIWGSSMDQDTVGSIHEIRVGVLHNMEKSSNMYPEFS